MVFAHYNDEIVGPDPTSTDTVTTMVALSGTLSDEARVSTAGYDTVGDGGGNAYITHTAGQSGETEDGGFVIFGTGDVWFEAIDQETANIAQFGALGDDDGTGSSGTDDTAAILAAVNSGAKYVRSHWSAKKYRILAILPLWSTHDGLILDMGNDWLMPDPELFIGNDVVQVISGGTADQTPAAHAEFKVVIKSLNINGNWDYAGYAAAVITQFSTDSTADTVAIGDTAQADIIATEYVDATYGTKRFNGLTFLIVSGGTGKSEAFHKNHIVEKLHVKNVAKSGLFIANPEKMKVGTVWAEGCGVHPVVTDWVSLAGDTEVGQGSLVIDEILVDGANTGFDFSTTVVASKTVYDVTKVPTIHLKSIVCKEIQGRTKIHGPWNLTIDAAVFKDPDMGNKNAALDIAGTSHNRTDIGSLEVDGYTKAYASAPVSSPPILTNIKHLLARNQNRIATTGTESRTVTGTAPHMVKIESLTTENCALIARNHVSIDHINCRMNIDEPSFWSNESAQYPFDLTGASIIKGGVIHDIGFGALIPGYVFFLRDPECSVSDLHLSSSVSDGTLLAWPSLDSVALDEYRYFQASPASVPQLWQSLSARTTRVTFDGTEQGFWTAIATSGNGGEGRARRFMWVNNSFNGQVRVDHCNMEGCWDRDFVALNTDRHSVAASNNTNIRFAALPTAAPTAGTYSTPLHFWYPEPAAGGMLGARLVSGGTPGTWEEFGAAPAGSAVTLGVLATTFVADTALVTVTGDGGANTIATITGVKATAGARVVLLFGDALVTITDDNSHAADSVDLSAAFTSADDSTLELMHNGTSWYEISRSVN